MFTRFAFSIVTDLPYIGSVEPPGGGKIVTIVEWVSWTVAVLAVVALMVVGAHLYFRNERGEGSNAASKLAAVLGGIILTSSATGIVSTLLK